MTVRKPLTRDGGQVRQISDEDRLASVAYLSDLTSGNGGVGFAPGLLNANKVSQQLGKAVSATELRTDDYGYVVL